jgi:uncharacterized protein (UPF0332 family)
MSLNEEDRLTVVQFRLEKAKETFAEIPILVENKLWRNAANRLYYASYYAVAALLIQYGIETHTHQGVINQLGLHFVRKGIVSNQYGKLYKQLFELRQTSDYSDWVTIEEEDIKHLIAPVEQFLQIIENLIIGIGA